MQQINPGLMKVLAAQSQINPVTPEGAPSVAANVLAQAGQAPGIAAIGQQAQEALPSMMRNAQDDQAKQMLEAAQRASQPAGIAGLNIPMGQFADGGVVGFAEGGIPVGEATEIGKIWSEEAKRWLKELLERQQATEAGKTAAPKVAEAVESSPSKLRTFVQGLRNVGSSGVRSAFSLPGAAIFGVGSLLSNRATEQMQQSPELREAYKNYMLGAMDPEGSMAAAILSQPTTPGPDQTLRERLGLGNEANRKVLESIDNLATKPQPTPVDTAPARFVWGQGMDPRQIISVLNNQLKTDKELTPENRTAIAKEIERQYEIYRSQQPVVTAEEAARRAAGPSGIGGLPTATGAIPGSEFFDRARQEYEKRKLTEELTPQQVQAKQDEYLRSLGMPTSLRPAEEARLAEMAKFDAQTREDNARRNKEAMQNAWMAGILKPAQNVARMLTGAAEGVIGEEGKQREQAIKDAALQRQQMMASNEIRAKLDAADRADALGHFATADKLREAARNDQNAQAAGLSNISIKQGEQAVEYRKGVDAARIAAEQKSAGTGERQDIVELRALIASLRDQADPMKNFDKPSRERAAILLGQAQDKLVHMSGLSGLPGGQIAPPVGTVMQGYRFKGGNPADRNNWEKV